MAWRSLSRAFCWSVLTRGKSLGEAVAALVLFVGLVFAIKGGGIMGGIESIQSLAHIASYLRIMAVGLAGVGIAIANRLPNITLTGAAGNSLTKVGAGTLVLSNNTNSYAGLTDVEAGVVSIAQESNLGATPGAVTANPPSRLDKLTLVLAKAVQTRPSME